MFIQILYNFRILYIMYIIIIHVIGLWITVYDFWHVIKYNAYI